MYEDCKLCQQYRRDNEEFLRDLEESSQELGVNEYSSIEEMINKIKNKTSRELREELYWQKYKLGLGFKGDSDYIQVKDIVDITINLENKIKAMYTEIQELKELIPTKSDDENT